MSEPQSGADSADAARAWLEARGIDYESLPCDPALADTEIFCERYGVALDDSANTILVASKSGPEQRFAACVLLATTRLDVNKVVRKRLGVRRISFATPEQSRDITGMELGGVTPFGLPCDLPVWIDAAVLAREQVVFGGGDRASKLRISAAAIRRLGDIDGIDVVEGLALAR